ncbi:SDR family NAD(P)-dependent oxidoreductase [Streptomyces albipurpureus]|uniref:SDR family oxidoreductase n=1 Tax=Streptomyces albipurpureus TaxID=2897419 RepID=A0ABT0USD2_9ACTN|nr:SDR family oxidoreductase [Streptomyces sp. CWNU-1]MCM2390980.1 SDR family oxidoreductase [Streptomyces sp. CWNU-1]
MSVPSEGSAPAATAASATPHRAPAPTRRTAIVTGAARGIGYGVARRLLAEGWNVLITDVDPQVTSAAQELDPTGERLVALVADVSRAPDATLMADRAVLAFGGVDALVANAAVGGPETPLLDTPDDEIQRVLEINFFGVLHCARAVRPLLVRGERPGRIVVLGSLFAQQPTPGAGAYSASKAAVQSLMHTLSVELAPRCTVNAVAPGYVMTEMHREELHSRARRSGRSFDEERERLVSEVPLARHGVGADVADAVHYLLSGADYVTGQTLNVNGGVLTS